MVSIERSKKNGQFYARITGGNNEKLMRSETVKTKLSALKNLHAVYRQLEKIFDGVHASTYKELMDMIGGDIVDNTKPKPKKKKRVKTNMILENRPKK